MAGVSAVEPAQRWRLQVRGLVQGVGFRPFVYRQATALGLAGWVGNTADGVTIEAEGDPLALEQLLVGLREHPPVRARVGAIEKAMLRATGQARRFAIHTSDTTPASLARVPADWAPCDACLLEMRDPSDRRYRYPFINCTDCGPRYSLIEALPYDRERTAMRRFALCEACAAEYHDPASRRFHAEPNACPDCGPQLAFLAADGWTVAGQEDALREAVARLREGRIVALKGVGGFQLLVDAANPAAVQRLRDRKQRPHKPLAVMMADVAVVQSRLRLSEAETTLLTGPERPIVLLRTEDHGLSEGIAPGIAQLGVMLPASPLHELLMDAFGRPLVATSGNRSGEPIAIDNDEAVARLGDIADGFLVHDRPILRPLDDSVARVVAGRRQILRRARGYAPQIDLPITLKPGSLALGGHLKNTVAMSTEGGVVLSQHLGDLDDPASRAGFERVVSDLSGFFSLSPERCVHDAHPDYYSSQYGAQTGLPETTVQHHVAHIAAVMAEHGLREPVLGIAWDGNGLGDDGHLWGGEFLRVDATGYQRLAHLRPFHLPGGEAAMREPRRCALGVLYELYGDAVATMDHLAPVAAFSPAERRLLLGAMKKDINAPQTTSVGRLFDAVVALVGLRQKVSYEGQGAMELEGMLDGGARTAGYPFELRVTDFPLQPETYIPSPPRGEGQGEGAVYQGAPSPHPLSPEGRGASESKRIGGRSEFGKEFPWQIDWQPAIETLLSDLETGQSPARIARAFHDGLIDTIVAVAKQAGVPRVVLSGGCFQNACLLEGGIVALQREGFDVFWPHDVPPNDGGLALGQLFWTSR
ncbi:carbamoyltransferase HypF [Marinobacteraceae bacterium S3BR75-40.1]